MYSEQTLRKILKRVASRTLSPQRAFQTLRQLPYETLQYAKIDHHRTLRKKVPEFVFAPGKSEKTLGEIIRSFISKKVLLMLTRVEPKTYRALKKRFPKLKFSETAKLAYFRKERLRKEKVAVVTAGTSDRAVAEEAAVMLEVLGLQVERFYDCGVAGIHRLVDHLPQIRSADFIICVAGMEGALPSVLAGLVDRPIVAVPTSVGYGAHFKGVSALLTMLNTCAQGVAVVNIDSGFNAACFAYLILSQ